MPLGIPPGLSESSPLGRLLGEAWNLIGQERFAEAIPLMQEAVAMQPNHGRLHADLGGLYVETGRHAEALAPLRRALEINPRIGIAHWRLGIALKELGDPDGAVVALEQAVAIRPDAADAHFRLALLHANGGRRNKAVASFRGAAKAASDPAEKLLFEAQADTLEQRDDEAEASLRSALALRPDLPAAHGLLAKILAESGRFAEAGRHYEAQISQSPRAGLCYYDYVRSRKFTDAGDPLLRRMETVLAEEKLDDVNRALIQLARAKAFDDLGRYEQAMKALDAAAEARGRAFAIDVGAFERQVDEIITLFGIRPLALSDAGNHDRTPLLILGMPRSGTTLAEQIVSSHPAIEAGSERAFWRNQLRTILDAGEPPDRAFLHECAVGYMDLLRAISPSAARVTDKDPFNFLAIGLIHMTFPRAAIVHCRRNPVDTALSIRHTHFSKSTGLPTASRELVRYFHAYRRLMDHWRRVLPRGRLYELDYETLTRWPRNEIPRLIEHIGVPWDDKCLSPHVNTRTVNTPSGWQVRQEINTGAIGRWKLYGPWLGALAKLGEDADDGRYPNAGTPG